MKLLILLVLDIITYLFSSIFIPLSLHQKYDEMDVM